MKTLDHYITLLESLSPANLGQLYELVCEDVRFSDPFNQVTGVEGYLELLGDMFQRLDEVRFTVHDCVQKGPIAYLYWTFTASSKTTGRLNFQGTSRLLFAEDGRVASHQDFWDSAAIYQQLPIIGILMRWLQRRAAHHG